MPHTYQFYESVKATTSCYDTISISAPGGYTFSKIHPNIVTESMISAQDSLPVLNASGSQLIQVFKSSHDNIHQLKFIAAIDSLASSSLCTFDFADDAALRAVWASNSIKKLLNYNDKVIVATGTSSMRITTLNANAIGCYIQRDLGSATDYSSSTNANIVFKYRKETHNITILLRFVDTSGNTASTRVGVSELNSWTDKQFDRGSFIDDQVTATDWTQIRYIRWVVESNTAIGQTVWVDDLKFNAAAIDNNLKIQIYHCGSACPTSASTIGDWTILTSDQGNTDFIYTVRTLKSMTGEYVTIPDTFGLNHVQPELTVDDYYAIVFTRQANALVIRGVHSATTDPYARGVLFQSADSGTTLSTLNNSAARFTLYSCINCRINSIGFVFNASPRNTKIFIAYNTGIAHCHSIMTGAMFYGSTLLHEEPIVLDFDKSNQIGIYIEHDKNSELTQINTELQIEYAHTSV